MRPVEPDLGPLPELVCVCVRQELEVGILHCNQFMVQGSFLLSGHIYLARPQLVSLARSNQNSLLEMTLPSLEMILELQQGTSTRTTIQQEGS